MSTRSIRGLGATLFALTVIGSLMLVPTAFAVSTPEFITQVGGFANAHSVAVGPTGDVYVCDLTNNVVRVYDNDLNPIDQWAGFSWPNGVAVAAAPGSGIVYVANWNTGVIQVYSPDGTYQTEFDIPGNPARLAVDASGFVYVSEFTNNSVAKYPPNGGGGMPVWRNNSIASPGGIAVDGGQVYVGSQSTNAIYVLNADTGAIQDTWTGLGLGQPTAIAADGDGHLFVADSDNNRVQILTTAGALELMFTGADGGGAAFAQPYGVAIDADGEIFVCEAVGARVQKFGTAYPTGTLQGTVTDATTGLPISGATVDAGAAGTFVTGPDGFYSFPDVAPGDYTVAASRTGYIAGSGNVTVAIGVTTTQDFALEPGPAPVVTTPASSGWSLAFAGLVGLGLLSVRRRRLRV